MQKSDMCKECNGTNKDCPFYVEAFHTDDICELREEIIYGEREKDNS